MKKTGSLTLLLILTTQIVFSQNTASALNEIHKINFETVYLHTDREFYFTGDTIWFAAYLLHPQTHAALTKDCNLYIELVDPEGNFADKELFLVQNGFCPGYLSFNNPDLPEGNFLIRAYTDVLKPYGDEMFFTKTISISKVKNSNEIETAQTINKVEKVHIGLYPEGGFLLANLLNQIAFKATDQNGNEVDVSGKLLDSKGNVIQRFSSVYKGAGSILLVPKPGEKYNLEIDGYPEIEYTFPEIREKGEKIVLAKLDDKGVEMNVLTNNPNTNSKFYVACLCRGQLNSMAEIKGNNLEKTVSIKGKLLKTGINRIVLMNSVFEPVSERLVFFNNDDDVPVKMQLNNTHFKTREKVEVEMERPKELPRNEKINLSMAVVNENALKATGAIPNIKTYLLLNAELKGYISNPADYFVDDKVLSSMAKLNLLMLTQGWSNYIWNTLSQQEEAPVLTPQAGITIGGEVYRRGTKKTIGDADLSLSVSDSINTIMDFATTDATGHFEFKNIQFFDSATVFIQRKDRWARTNTTFVLDPPGFNSPEITDLSFSMLKHFNPTPLELYRQKYFNDLKLKEFIPDKNSKVIGEVKVTAPKPFVENKGLLRPYSIPSISLKVNPEKDYPYADVFQYMAGRIRGGIVTRSEDGEEHIRLVSMAGYSGESGEYALILIDGLETTYNVIETLNMADIDKIDVLEFGQAASYGKRGANGVINIITRRGGEHRLDPRKMQGTIIKRIKGFSAYREFYSPRYTPQNIHSKIPDFRTTLYWNPSVQLNDKKTNISFFTCDNVSRYHVFVEGITESGKICLGETRFEVNEFSNQTSSLK